MFPPNLLTKRQQRAVLFLMVVIFALQLTAVFWPMDTTSDQFEELSNRPEFQQEYQQLKQQWVEAKTPKIFPFNPNYISTYNAYKLGLSSEAYNRLKAFRAKNQWVNSAVEFQQVTQISDELLENIQPYFKFPQWVVDAQKSSLKTQSSVPKIDLNDATAQQLEKIRGIGPVLSERIIRYRERHEGGFADWVELTAVYGLSETVIQRLKNRAVLKNPRTIRKINLNEATQEDLVKIPYIDYELADQIIEQRLLKEHYESVDELTKLKDFPVEFFDIIKLYLYINYSE